MIKLTQNIKPWVPLLGGLAVILGAFGAHALKNTLSAPDLEVWKTAVLYHFLHTLALGAFRPGRWPSMFFLAGIGLFSGSLYLLSTSSLHGMPVSWLGPVTPLGGLLLIAGWLLTAAQLRRNNAENGRAA